MDLNCEVENIWAFAYLSIYTDELKVITFLIFPSLSHC